MKSIIEVKNQIRQEPEYWQIPFMDFVDDFRRHKEISIDIPYKMDDEKIDALRQRLNTFAMNKAWRYPIGYSAFQLVNTPGLLLE